MSHTERNYRPSDKLEPKDIPVVAEVALSLIKVVGEPNPAIREVALMVVGHFREILNLAPQLEPAEAIRLAKAALYEQRNQGHVAIGEPSELKCGSAMAEKALKLSRAIIDNKGSYSKALVQMERIIAQRERRRSDRNHTKSSSMNRSSGKATPQRLPKRHARRGFGPGRKAA